MHKRRLLWLMIFIMSACMFRTFAQVEDEDIADDDGDEEDSAVYLLKEQRIKVERNGLKTIREHNVLKILKRSAIEYAGDIGFEYNSYYSKAKLVKAFTLTPEGRKIEVSKDAVHDTMPQNFQEFKMYSDVRTLHFSMPAVEVGSVLDYEIEVVETKPVMEGQAWDSRYLDDSQAVEDSRYVLEYPSKMKLQLHTLNVTNSPTTNVNSSVTTVSLTLKNTPKLKYESGMPPLHGIRKSIHFTSLSSWDTVRDWFAKLAAEKIRTSDDIQKLVANLTSNAPTAGDKIRALSLMMQRDVRYVGVELGRSAYEPHHAVDCLRNKYGDCKDKSILLVSMLKQAGIRAFPALVRPSYFGELVMATPHPGQFNHVIVYVPDQDLWLDPTAKYYDIDVYPAALDGCQALVVGNGTTNFVTIPFLAPERDITRTRYEVDMHHNGRCLVKEISESVGRAGAEERIANEEVKKEKRQEQLETAFERKDGRERLIAFGNSDPHDLSRPFESWVSYETDLFLERANMGFGFSVSAQTVEDPLYLGRSDDSGGGKSRERQHEWMARNGCIREISCRIRMPRGFAPDELPSRQEYNLPHGRIEIGCTQSSNILTASCMVSRKSCVIPPAKWKKARNDTDAALSKASITVALVNEIEKLMIKDKPSEAISRLVAWQQESPTNGEYHHRLAGVYHRCGLLVNARKEYRKAIDLGYRDLDVYSDFAETYGGFGGVYGRGFKREEVMRVLKPATETSNDKEGARYLLASASLRDDKGVLFGRKAPFKDAIAIYETLAAEKAKSSRPLLAMGRAYFAAGDYEKSEACFEKAFELDKLSLDAQAGKWTCAAFLGRSEETINAIRNGVGDSGAQAAELQRIAVKLMFNRKYAEAGALLTKANALSPGKQAQRDLPKLLNKMARQEQPNYETYFDLSTPRKAVISMIAGMFLENTEQIEKACSERMKFSRNELEEASFALRATLGESMASLTDFSLDLLANVWTASERQLDDNHLELNLSPPKEQALGSRKGTKITCILRKEANGEWRICAMGHGTFFAAALAVAASWCIEHNDMDGAKFYVDQIASHIASVPASTTIEGKSSVRDMLDELDREEFTNKVARTLAYTGVSLAEVSKYIESAGYLRRAVILEPDNVTIKRMLGEVLISGALYEEAEKMFGLVVARKPNDWRAMQQQITALAHSQRDQAALALLPRLREIAPSAQQVALTEMLVYQEAGRFDDAMKAFQKARSQLHPVVAFGMEASLLGFMQRRIELERLADEDQDTEPAMKPMLNRSLAGAYMLMAEPVRAAEQLECMMMRNMEDIESMMRLAFLMIDKNDYEEATSMAERAVSAPLLPGEARLDIGDVCLALGRFDEAEKLFEKAKEGTKADRGVYRELMLGAYRLIRGGKDDAARCFKNASAVPLGSVWPAPLCKFYAGEATLEDLLKIAEAQPNPLRRGQFLCETYFYVAAKAIGDGDKKKAAELLTKAIETKSYMTSEFILAKAQLRLLQGGK